MLLGGKGVSLEERSRGKDKESQLNIFLLILIFIFQHLFVLQRGYHIALEGYFIFLDKHYMKTSTLITLIAIFSLFFLLKADSMATASAADDIPAF